MMLPINNWLWKQTISAFLTTRTEADNWKCPSNHATHRQLLMFTLAVKWQTEAKENAYMETKLWCRGSAWNSNISVVSPLNGSTVATSTWRESFLQASIVPFLLFFFSLTIWIITTSHCLNTYLLKTFYTVDSHLQPSYYYSLKSARSLKAGM